MTGNLYHLQPGGILTAEDVAKIRAIVAELTTIRLSALHTDPARHAEILRENEALRAELAELRAKWAKLHARNAENAKKPRGKRVPDEQASARTLYRRGLKGKK